MMKYITPKDVTINDSWIHVNGLGTIGMYKKYDHAIGLDYSMKWIVGTNEDIPCFETDIVQKIVELFNKNF